MKQNLHKPNAAILFDKIFLLFTPHDFTPQCSSFMHRFTNCSNISHYPNFVMNLPEEVHRSCRNMQATQYVYNTRYFYTFKYICWFRYHIKLLNERHLLFKNQLRHLTAKLDSQACLFLMYISECGCEFELVIDRVKIQCNVILQHLILIELPEAALVLVTVSYVNEKVRNIHTIRGPLVYLTTILSLPAASPMIVWEGS